MMRRILTVIPARGGSKRLPRKNCLEVGGKPLIGWAIEKARQAGLEKIIVSTEDEEIAALARKYDVEVPFIRPQALSRDNSTLLQVNEHALRYFDNLGDRFDAVLSIHVSAPLIPTSVVSRVVKTFHSTEADSVVTVSQIKHGHPLQAKRIQASGEMRFFLPVEPGGSDRFCKQKLEPLYYANCGVYLRDRKLVEAMDRSTNGLGPSPKAVVVPPEQSVDIDEKLDLVMAQSIIESGLVDILDG